MSTYNDWKLNATYSFSTAPTTGLPSTYQRVKLISVCGYDAALRIGTTNIYAMWRRLYPALPAGTPDTPHASLWYVFETEDKQVLVLAAEWINGSTVAPVTFQQYDIAVTNSDETQLLRIRDFLNKIGATYVISRRV